VLGIGLEDLSLFLKEPCEEFDLSAHGDILPNGHCGGPRYQAGQARTLHDHIGGIERNTWARPMPFCYGPARVLCPTAIGVPRCSSPCIPASMSLAAFRVFGSGLSRLIPQRC
jgi:hypothetical protein